MTLIGALLTALVVAREWERGTLEALFVTPVRADEILLGKIVPYFVLGMVGFALTRRRRASIFSTCRCAVRCWVLIDRLDALSAGRARHRARRFVGRRRASSSPARWRSSATLLPALMLSGFLFDIRSMPIALQYITYALPARYFVTLLQTIFLAGDIWSVILPNAAMLGGDGRPAAGASRARRPQAAVLRRAMQETLLRILALIRKELLAILKDPRSRVVLVVPPIFQTLMFGYAATFDLNRVPYAVLDQDRSAASSTLLAGLDGRGLSTRRQSRPRGRHRDADRQPHGAARRADRPGFRAAPASWASRPTCR